ncbi:hypothetical protein SNEBB_007152 [Seison nebaliae]|nr:hypothetical protein SNEBB_007152 [Seison nebaliae]
MAKEVNSDILLFDAPLYSECQSTFTHYNDDLRHYNADQINCDDGAENETNLFTSSDDFQLLNYEENSYMSCDRRLSHCHLFPTLNSHLLEHDDLSFNVTNGESFENYFSPSLDDGTNVSDEGISCSKMMFQHVNRDESSPESFASNSPSGSSSSSIDQFTTTNFENLISHKDITTSSRKNIKKNPNRKRLKKEASMKYREKKKTIKQDLFNRRNDLKKKNEIMEKKVDDINRRIDMYKILLADIIIKKSTM